MGQEDQAGPGSGVPTSGTNRPGPLGGMPADVQPGVIPVKLELERLGVSAAIEVATFADDVPSEPASPELLAWYQRSAPLGIPGVVLIGGLTTTSETGPSAFTRLSEVEAGDLILLTGANDGIFHYTVEQSGVIAETPDFDALLGHVTDERLTLLGWTETFSAAANLGLMHQVTALRTIVTPRDG